MKNTPPVLLFDGVCNLCSASVQFVLKYDTRGRFQFASLQSKEGQELLKKHGLPIRAFQSFVLIRDGRCYSQSTAALQVARDLKFPINLLSIFLIIPRPIRDFFYKVIAKNRYRWFGKKESCWLPRPEWKERFID